MKEEETKRELPVFLQIIGIFFLFVTIGSIFTFVWLPVMIVFKIGLTSFFLFVLLGVTDEFLQEIK